MRLTLFLLGLVLILLGGIGTATCQKGSLVDKSCVGCLFLGSALVIISADISLDSQL